MLAEERKMPEPFHTYIKALFIQTASSAFVEILPRILDNGMHLSSQMRKLAEVNHMWQH
jgi:hypothetical protein